MSSSVRIALVGAVLMVSTATLHGQDVLPAPAAPGSTPDVSAVCEMSGCDMGCCDGWQCCRPSKWRHVRAWLCPGCFCTTGMMYPHYPYFPERHGYYDFAPYNAGVLVEQKRLAPALGETMLNPFARAGFATVYESLPNTDYPGKNDVGIVPPLERVEAMLPDLESTLDARKSEPKKVPPAPGTN